MSFDEIPENKYEGYSCDCGGSITLQDGVWECDLCEFKKIDQKYNQQIQPTTNSNANLSSVLGG